MDNSKIEINELIERINKDHKETSFYIDQIYKYCEKSIIDNKDKILELIKTLDS